VTTPIAQDDPQTVRAATVGAAWRAVAGRILTDGVASCYDGLPIREISHVTLAVEHPDPRDEVIARLAEPERLAWMHANFTDHSQVAALGGADSYATRLFDYEHSGRDQVAWVVDRLRGDPTTRSAAITTFQPRTDATYIPCVSLLDFWLPGGSVELIVYAHSIDFGAKGYGNLVELARLQHHVAGELGRPPGRLLMTVKSAHVYETEFAYVRGILAEEDGGRRRKAAVHRSAQALGDDPVGRAARSGQSGAGSSPRPAALASRRASFRPLPRACGGTR
jgi:Thymidylate synthase